MAENPVTPPRETLKKLIIAQKSAALPDQPTQPDYQELHKEMAAYDRFVSETVIRVLGGEKDAQPYPDVVALNQAFERLSALPAGKLPLMNLYRRYQDRLDTLLETAIAAASQP